MEQPKNTKELITLVIFLILFILGLIGFIVNDKLLNNKENKNPNKDVIVTQKNGESQLIDVLSKFASLPNNDSTILWSSDAYDIVENNVDLKTDFRNVKYDADGFNLTFDCSNYGDENGCTALEISINSIKHNLIAGYEYGLSLIATNDFLIIYENGYAGTLKVFNKVGDQLFEEYITTTFGIDGNEEFSGFMPVINYNQLYYVKCGNSTSSNFELKYYDLKTNEIKDIINFKGTIGIH